MTAAVPPVDRQQQRLEDRRDEFLHRLQPFGLVALLQQGRDFAPAPPLSLRNSRIIFTSACASRRSVSP